VAGGGLVTLIVARLLRWKLLGRRFSIGAPRMIVRSHLPWPLRWAFVAVMLGFSAALAVWAFETGKSLAGVGRDAQDELLRLRAEVTQLRAQRDRAQAVANSSESLLKAEQAAQQRLAEQIKQAEAEVLSVKADLGFFERLLPAASGGDGVAVRAFQVEVLAPGQLRYQVLVMQPGRAAPEFHGRYDVLLTGTQDGKPWSASLPGGPKPLQVKQYARLEGLIDHPAQAVVKTAQLRLTDNKGLVAATQNVRL
jgi:hypothetical protein